MSDEAAQSIAVVVITYDSGRDIEGFLDSVGALEQDTSGKPVHVVVVDNASTDDTLERVRAHQREVLVVETGANLGYAAGINAGTARLEHDELVIVANPDVRFLDGRCSALLAACQDPNVGVAAPRLIDENGALQHSLRRDPSLARGLAEAILGGRRAAELGLSEVIVDAAAYARAADVEWVAGALLAITPQCRRVVGDWDDSYFLYSEETDYLLRVRDAGLRVRYEPAAVAFHRGGASHVDPFLWSTLATNRVRLYASRHGRLRGRAYLGVVMLNELLRWPRSATHRRALRCLFARRHELLAIKC